MKVLCITIGSAGDVHPFVGIALEMKQRGHEVAVATNGHFRELIERVGLRFIELGEAAHYREGIKNPDLWHRRRAFKLVFEWGVTPLIRKTYDLIARESAAGDTVVVASSLALGARVAQEKLGVPTVSVHLAPSVFRSLIDPPVLPGLFMPRWLPIAVKRGMFEGGDKYVIDPIIGPAVAPLRAELGLPPVSAYLREWWHSPTRTIGLFPGWYADAPDWPKQLKLTGFALWDESGVTKVDETLEKFLNAGPPPIAFTPGSAMVHGQRFFQASILAAKKLNRRAVLLTRHPEQLPSPLPEGVLHAHYAPFSALLPRCAALVHHGGIGTTAQALAAGIPQLIVPMAHDQPDNANRLTRLGVATHLRPTFYRPGRVARKLRWLLTDPGVKLACTKAKLRLISENPLERTCDEIEAVMKRNEPQMHTDAHG